MDRSLSVWNNAQLIADYLLLPELMLGLYIALGIDNVQFNEKTQEKWTQNTKINVCTNRRT